MRKRDRRARNRATPKVTCPKCGHPEILLDGCVADGRPQFKCGGNCDNTWTCGYFGGEYAAVAIVRLSR